MPGIYRQTTETTGTYSPFKKHLSRAHQIIPSKNCATQKVIPSQITLFPYDYEKRVKKEPPLEVFKSSYSLPHLKQIVNLEENSPEYEYFYQYYAQVRKDNDRTEMTPHRHEAPPSPPLELQHRPYTPPEKRYNVNFGKSMEQQRPARRPRPKSCIYEDVHVEADETYAVKVNSDRSVNYNTNVRVGRFPTPEFNQMYIQDQFD